MTDNTLLWYLLFALWICCIALLEPLAIGLRNYRAYRREQKRMKDDR